MESRDFEELSWTYLGFQLNWDRINKITNSYFSDFLFTLKSCILGMPFIPATPMVGGCQSEWLVC